MMPVVIKKIHVNTVVEKKVILPEEISGRTLEFIMEQVIEELSSGMYPETVPSDGRRER